MDTQELEALDLFHYSLVNVNGAVLESLELCVAMQSWVNREYRRGLSTHSWGCTIRKCRIQLQRELFSPRFLSLVMSFEGTMMLNTEL